MNKKVEKSKNSSTVKGHWVWGLIVFCLLILIDLLTKVAAEVYFDRLENADIKLIPGVIELTYVENRGVAFSGAANADPAFKLGIVIGTALIMLGATVVYFKVDARRTFLRWCLVFVVAGGVGNLIDRVLFRMWAEDGGGVRDMVLLNFSPWAKSLLKIDNPYFLNFGVCNFADFFIVGGAVALILCMLFFDTDAFVPVGKYKQLAKEAAEKEEAKQAEKAKKVRE